MLRFPLRQAFHTLGPVLVPASFQKLLTVGVKYIPKDAQFVRNFTIKSLASFRKDIGWALVFGWNSDPSKLIPLFRPPASYAPPELSGKLLNAVLAMEAAILACTAHGPNKSFDARLAQKFKLEWASRYIIRPADKNLGLCIMSRDRYLSLAAVHIQSYEFVGVGALELVKRVVDGTRAQLIDALSAHSGALNRDVFRHLIVTESLCSALPTFYILPKLHKVPVASRPIVANHSACVGAPTSRWLAALLQPLVQSIPWILPDTNALIHRLVSTQIPDIDNIILITGDVASMYPNMETDVMCSSLSAALFDHKLVWSPQLDRLTLQLVQVLFSRSFLKFDGSVYRQRSGVPMGTPAAPPLANIYLYECEKHVLELFKDDVLMYGRFIDDIFCLCRNTESARRFVAAFSALTRLKVEWNMDAQSVSFLDIVVYKGPLGRFNLLDFQTHRKALNQYLYIPPFSSHSAQTMRSWIRAEMLRLRRTNTQDATFKVHAQYFFERLRLRGFGPRLLHHVLSDMPALVSPLLRPPRIPSLKQSVAKDGQVFATPPPHILRAPFSADLVVPFRAIVNSHFPRILQALPRISTPDWMPRLRPLDIRIPADMPMDLAMLIDQFRTHQPSCHAVAMRLLSDIRQVCTARNVALMDALSLLPEFWKFESLRLPIVVARVSAPKLLNRISRADISLQ